VERESAVGVGIDWKKIESGVSNEKKMYLFIDIFKKFGTSKQRM
jgi:hypothetical protein